MKVKENYNIKKQLKIVKKINDLDFSVFSNEDIKKGFWNLKNSNENKEYIIINSFAYIKEAIKRTLGFDTYDEQLVASLFLYDGEIIEMQTGEGKTLCAVYPCCTNVLFDKYSHVLTFNDYLAKRDACWMGVVYDFFGISVSYITEKSSFNDRQLAYKNNVLYLTAREAGFDYLKNFLCTKKEYYLEQKLDFVIIDEADSLLIDEARIPLVIAGNTKYGKDNISKIYNIANEMIYGIHYLIDENKRNIYLTDRGNDFAEESLCIENIYSDENINTLIDLNNSIHAKELLNKDIDYIIKNGKIELVDEFTGRIAQKRNWPERLQTALETKEGISNGTSGQILAQITLQNFLSQYNIIAGMTGTIASCSQEIYDFYKSRITVIPTHKKIIKVNHDDEIFTTKKSKLNYLIEEIKIIHETKRPILIGTLTIEESQEIYEALLSHNIKAEVLNAKNDELEAKIISQAGMLGAITVSTNMAGRGTDIKLGGEQGIDKDLILQLGGLYVIGTNRHESTRIDNQLKGRCGRLGDPGSTKFFISLEDDLMVKYKIEDLLKSFFKFDKAIDKITDKRVLAEINRIQRIIEGQNYDIRKNLIKYSILLEEQRKIIFKIRYEFLFSNESENFYLKYFDEFNDCIKAIDKNIVINCISKLSLYFINNLWADYLDYVAYIREGIHLVNIAGKNPLDEYNKEIISAFDNMLSNLDSTILEHLHIVDLSNGDIDMEKEGLICPTSTWTYLINDSPRELGISTIATNPINFINPASMILALFEMFSNKKKK